MTISKEQALKVFQKRREENARKERINNADLPAGSPMHYYCHRCKAEQILPENHTGSDIKQYCDDCQPLVDCGWI